MCKAHISPISPFAVPSDFVAVAVRIFVNETVELATREFKFYNCAATVRKSENTPWVRFLMYQFCSVTHWKYTVTLNTASTDNLDVNVSPCMNRWEIKAVFVNCDAWWFWMHLLHFLSSFYYQAEEIASVSFSLIKKWKSISPFFPPPSFFFFIPFMPRNVWWTSFAYVKLQRSISLSATWIFVLDTLWWVCMFKFCLCVLLCACAPT